jgi:hypothetical protein
MSAGIFPFILAAVVLRLALRRRPIAGTRPEV